jgi:hypothetical protein
MTVIARRSSPLMKADQGLELTWFEAGGLRLSWISSRRPAVSAASRIRSGMLAFRRPRRIGTVIKIDRRRAVTDGCGPACVGHPHGAILFNLRAQQIVGDIENSSSGPAPGGSRSPWRWSCRRLCSGSAEFGSGLVNAGQHDQSMFGCGR